MSEKEKILTRAFELGLEYEQTNKGCAQCTLAAIQDTLHLENDQVFKSASALSGGLADTTNGTCGALTGGAMAIGYKCGRERSHFNKPGAMRESNRLARELQRRFVEEYGSCICREVQERIFGRSFNFRDPKEIEEFDRAGGHKDKCPMVVAKTARHAVEILLEASGL